jgi:hypothetical protein
MCSRWNYKHGYSREGPRTPEYRAWCAMKARCLNPMRPNYHRYGGRGIKICQEWIDSFEAFVAYVGPKPPSTSLGRIDNDGNYEPGNVRWETVWQQQKNKVSNRPITINGITKLISEWAKEIGIAKQGLSYRIEHWPEERWCEKSRRSPKK